MAFKSVLRLLLLCFSVLGVAWGQTPNPADAQFTQNFGTDSINLQDLSIGIKAPVISKPGAIPFYYTLYGMNSCQGIVNSGQANAICGFLNRYGPSTSTCVGSNCLSLPYSTNGLLWSLYSTQTNGIICSDGGTYSKHTNFMLVSPDGTTYSLPATDYTQSETGGTLCNHSFTDYTLSGGISVSASNLGLLSSLIFPNGSTYTGSSIVDTFGNSVSRGAGTYADTLVNPALSFALESGATGEIDTYKDTGGTSQQVTQILTPETQKTTFGCATYPDQTLTGKHAVTEIDYPDNNNIGLSYEVVAGGITGRIASVTLRTGGTVNYSYGSMNCPSMIPSSLTRTDADGARTYTFAMSGTHGTTTTVRDAGKNKTVYAFQGTDSTGLPVQGVPLTLTQVQVYRNTGTVAAPVDTLISRTLYCYNNIQTNCDTTQATYPITQKDTYVLYGTMVVNSRVKETFDSFGNLLTSSKYDFGAASPTIVSTIQYGSWNGTSCVAIGSGIINKPCRVTTVGAGSTIADATYSYLSNGFLSGENHWNGTSWITTMTASANGNGTVHQRYNSLGTPTTFTYAGTGSGGCNSILPTGTAITIGAAVLNTSATWDCNGGKLLTSTDENSNQSQFTYDLMFRPFSQTDPLTYQVNELYSQTTAQVSDPYITTTTTVGGFGRVNRVQTTDGASYDTVSTSYAFNANSNTQFQISTSQPCIAAVNADCTKNHFVVLDPAGREITSSTTSNETLATVYYGDATHSVFDIQTTISPAPAGENVKKVQKEFNGLGQLLSVCEIQVTGGSSCGQAMGGSGIKTSYAYTYAAGQTTVTETRGSQVHTKVYDAAGRVKSVTIPEGGSTLATSGTTSYIYDQASATCSSGTAPGLLLETVDNAGVHTCQGYDAAMRPTNTFVAGTSSPCRVLVYGDQSGLAVLNGDNRIVEAWTDADCSGASKITDEQFSYDKVGRVKDVWETTPHSGGQYHTTASYYLNGQLNTLSGVPGKSTYTVSLNPNGRPNSATLGATALINSVTRNGAGQVTNFAWGSGSSSDAYTFDANTGRMKTYTFTVGASTDNGTLTWNANGTLKTLAIVDGLNAGGTQTCNFTYDDVVRILTDNCGAVWNQSYAYSDQYNNFSKSGSTNWNPGYSTTNNHITAATYDSDGQVTYDKNNSFAWDGYHRMITANAGAALGNCGSAGVTCVTYDAFGRPVERNVAGTFTEFLYSPLGLTATMSGQTTSNLRLPLPGGGSLNSTSANNAIYHPDWLGSARLATNTGTSVLLDTAYTPYGEKYATFGTNPQNFTGDYQDLYAGLFDTLFREFDVASGSRWLSPDPAHASWNAYSYPTNPNTFIDPSGLDSCANTSKTCKPQRGTPGGNQSGSGGPMDVDGSVITSPDGAFGMLYPSFFGSTTTNSSSVIQVGGQSYVLVPGPDGCGNTSCGAGYIAVGNGLQPIMTVTPQHGTGTGKSLHKKKQKLNRILPFLVMLAHQPTPEEWAMYYQVVGDTAASLETEWIAAAQELLALGNMTPPAVLANDQSVIPLLDSMMGTYAGGTMAVGGGMSMAGPAGAGFAAAGMAVIYLGYESISPENTNQFMPPMN